MSRHFWVLIHRYAGLYMAFILIVAGLTGSILAFYHELDHLLNPHEYRVAIQDKPMLSPFDLRDLAMSLEPYARINQVYLQQNPGEIYSTSTIFGYEPRLNPMTGKPYEIKPVKINPYTGERIPNQASELPQNQATGYWPLTRKNILPFIYELHYSLAFGNVGRWMFGIAATIWTVDCFVSFYLTLPMRRKTLASLVDQTKKALSEVPAGHKGEGLGEWKLENSDFKIPPHPSLLPQGEGAKASDPFALIGKQRSFWQRWQVAWKIKLPSSTPRLNFDLHRAGGLWTWPVLFIFAWSSVLLNLGEQVYIPVMKQFFLMSDAKDYPPIADLQQPRSDPAIDFKAAYQIGKRLMAEQARQKGFTVLNERSIDYLSDKGIYQYVVRSEYDIDANSLTTLWFDATTSQLVGVYLPTGQKTGDTISLWLQILHMAKIWGLPYKLFVCFMGLVIAMLSVTGVYIWWKKHRAANVMQKKTTSAVNMPGLNN